MPRFAHDEWLGRAIRLESVGVQDLANKVGLACVGRVHGVMDNVSNLFDVDAHGDGSAAKGDFVQMSRGRGLCRGRDAVSEMGVPGHLNWRRFEARGRVGRSGYLLVVEEGRGRGGRAGIALDEFVS